MGDERDRPALLPELEDAIDALPLEGLVPTANTSSSTRMSASTFVATEKPSRMYAGRVRPDRQVDELPELAELDDVVQPCVDVRLAEPVDRAAEIDVLAAREVGMEARAELEQRADSPVDGEPPARGAEHAGDHPEQRRLSRAVPAHEPDRSARLNPERDVLDGS